KHNTIKDNNKQLQCFINIPLLSSRGREACSSPTFRQRLRLASSIASLKTTLEDARRSLWRN
ncbi:hypothetical protein L9F63_020646, partial [Diploptera punctata]